MRKTTPPPVTSEDHVQGPADAPVTLIEYADLECPFCASAADSLAEILSSSSGQVRYVFRHYPLEDVHELALDAALAAEAAGAQGKFWAMHNLLFADQEDADPGKFLEFAQELGLDLPRFERDLKSEKHAARIARDIASGEDAGIETTPTFFINGRKHEGGSNPELLERAIRHALRGAKAA